MSYPKPRNAYDRQPVRVSFKGAKRVTEQSHKAACDINGIMAKFQKTGAIEHVRKFGPRYGDVTGADFTQAQFLVAEMCSQFEELPSALRSRFNNDPAEFLDFVSDESNSDEMAEIGLIEAPGTEAAEKASESLSEAQAQPETNAEGTDAAEQD